MKYDFISVPSDGDNAKVESVVRTLLKEELSIEGDE